MNNTEIVTTIKEMIALKGEISSPINLPDACRFHKRCDVTCPMAETGEPPLIEVKPGHFVACYCVGKQDE